MAAGGNAAGAPVIVVHSLAHAVAALGAAAHAGREILIASAPDAGIYAGPGWFRELVKTAREAAPTAEATALLDCGDDAGAAQGAIRAGVEGVVFTGRTDVAARLADIAGQRGVTLVTTRPEPALDLATLFFADADTLRRRCADVLASLFRFC
jgi:delta 1-pyrroline-5-carboxylate dehydrogenase